VYTLEECTVFRTPLDGGAATPLAALSLLPNGPCIADGTTIAIDNGGAYWPIMVGGGNPLNSGSVQSAPLAGGSAPPGVVASAQNGPNNVAVDATYVYWTNHGVNGQPGQVMRANKPSGR
jgi:hypothetical protein